MNAKTHALKVAAAKVLVDIVTEGYEGVRADAEQVFGAARRELGAKTLDVDLDGDSLGTVSILAGPAAKKTNMALVAAVAAAEHGTVQVLREDALEDANLIAFVRDQLPHLMETKVSDDDLKATLKRIDKNGYLKQADGTKVKVVEISHGEPTGEFRFRASAEARAAVLAAWERGELRELFAELVRPSIEAGEQ